jgi:hypothetical protein
MLNAELIIAARKSMRSAAYMLDIAYPMEQEPRILMAAASRIYQAMVSCMQALLAHERGLGRLPAGQEGFKEELGIFKARSQRRYRFKEDYPRMLAQLHNLMEKHRTSHIEFGKGGNLVICKPDYKCTILTRDDMKHSLEKAKLFIQETETFCSR